MVLVVVGWLSLWVLWPIGSVIVVGCIVVFLGLEVLAYWMGPRDDNNETQEIGYDGFSKKTAYSLTALVLLFVLLCVVLAVGLWLG